MKYIALILVAGIFLSTSCSSVKMDTPEMAKELVEFNRSACFGNCASYNIKVHTDGSVIYHGKRNVERMGIYKQQLTKKEYKDLYKMLEKSDLYQFRDSYDSDIQDGQTTRIIYSGAKGEKQIDAKYNFPGSLKSVVEGLDAIATREDGWIGIKVPKTTGPKTTGKSDVNDPNLPQKEDQPTRKVFSYNQGPCHGTCPAFSIDLLTDRSMIFVGRKFSKKEGIWERKLSEEDYHSLISLLENGKFQELEAVYDQDIMDAQQFTLKYYNDKKVEKSVKTKITQSDHLQAIIKFVREIADDSGWKQTKAKDAKNIPASTILVSLKPSVDSKKWVATQSHLKLKIVRYLSPNGTYFLVAYDMDKDINRVMEELRRNRDVLAVSEGDRSAKPRSGTGVKSGKSSNHGKGKLGGE